MKLAVHAWLGILAVALFMSFFLPLPTCFSLFLSTRTFSFCAYTVRACVAKDVRCMVRVVCPCNRFLAEW